MKKDFIKQTAAAKYAHSGPLPAARYLAQTLFKDMTDKAGAPYIGHIERVAAGVNDPVQKTIAYLHDLVEDIEGWGFEDLEHIGFRPDVMAGVQAVTHQAGDLYFDMVVKLGTIAQAIPVKMSDLRDNSNPLRLPRLPTAHDIQRIKKYRLAYEYLSDIRAEEIKPGTPFSVWMKAQSVGLQDWKVFDKFSSERPDRPPGRAPGPPSSL